jgi:hypothetical protein
MKASTLGHQKQIKHDLEGGPKKMSAARRIVRLLFLVSAPVICMQLVLLMGAKNLTAVEVDQLELFAGKREVTKAGWRYNRRAFAIEKKDDAMLSNILTTPGFIHTTHLTMGMKKISNSVLAPVCSSWGKINMATSCRRKSNPEGDVSKAYAKQG